jgi:hypothetical protein
MATDQLTPALLQSIVDNACAVPHGFSASQLTPPMLEWLGSPNSDLRENSLSVVWEWILGGYYSNEELHRLGVQMAHNLTVGLGEENSDSVFLRAFSGLILGALVVYDQTRSETPEKGPGPFFQQAEVVSFLDQGLAFFQNEKDLRGYEAETGWAHAIAHGADLLRDLARSRFLGRAELERILNAVASRVIQPASRPLLFNEDERMATAVLSVLLRDELDLAQLSGWLETITHPADQRSWKKFYLDDQMLHAHANTKEFLRSLYFQLLFGLRNHWNDPYFDRKPQILADLRPLVARALLDFDSKVFYQNP